MNRIAPTTTRIAGSSLPKRRAGTRLVAIAAVAGACVLAACGPDEQIAVAPDLGVLQAPAVETVAPKPAPIAGTVPSNLVITVADRRDNQSQSRATRGRVTSIEPITERPKTSGAGAVVGGVLGAVVGNQFGSGGGRAATTVLGGVGGAVVGNKIEKHRNETVVGYRVRVELDNGDTRTFERNSVAGLDVGSRVRVDGGRLREI